MPASQVITELKAGDAYQMVGICQSLNSTADADAVKALRAANITLLRCSVLSYPDVAGLLNIHSMMPELRLNVLVLAYAGITWQQQLPLIQQLPDSIVESIEGPNEENLFGGHAPDSTTQYASDADIKAGTLAWAQLLQTTFPSKRIYSPTIALAVSNTDYAAKTPNMAGVITHTAIHKYPGVGRFLCNDDGHGNSPEQQTSLPWYLGWARNATGVTPTVITETGSAGCDPYQSGIVSTTTQAKIVVANLLDCLALGINRVFLYNLISTNDPGNNQGSESHYGLLNPDLTPKAAGLAIARLQGLLYDPGASAYTPPALPVTVSGMDNTASAAGTYLSFRKSDGSDIIITWNEPIIYANGDTDVTPPAVNVTVGWGSPRPYVVVDMIDGTIISSGYNSSVAVPLVGGARAVQLASPTAATRSILRGRSLNGRPYLLMLPSTSSSGGDDFGVVIGVPGLSGDGSSDGGGGSTGGGSTGGGSTSAMSQTFTISNWGSGTSVTQFKRGIWFKKGDMPAGSVPALDRGTWQFYGVSRWSDGSMKTARMLLQDTSLAASASQSYTMTAITSALPAGATAAVGNAGLVSALAGHDIKASFANVQTWDCSSTNGNYAPLGSGAYTASLASHAATSTRWTLLTTGSVADVWQGWGMATDNSGGAPDAHLKVNWYVTRWKNADGSTLGFQVGAVVALDWWSVASKFFLLYDATLKDGSTTLVSYTGVRHHYQSQWLMCINDGGLNAGTAPWTGAPQPTLGCSFDRDYAVACGVVPPLDTAKRPTPAPQYAYVPCGVVADTDQVAHPNSHRPAIDAAGGYQGRGVITRFDADAFMAGTPQAYAVARLNALSGLGVPYHYRSNRTRTRPGESTADTANTIIPLLMSPKAASYSDFTAQGLPIAVDAYNGSSSNNNMRDGWVWQTGLTTSTGNGYPYYRLNTEPAGSTGPWSPSLDASHGVSYCYFMALVSGDEWLVEAQLDLTTNLAHQAIPGYHNNVQPFAITWNSATPATYWTGLLAQYQQDAIRSIGWSQLIQGHGFSLLPVDHPAYGYSRAAMAQQADYIQTNLDNLPADFAASSFYSPDSGLGLFSLYSPWMNGFIACGAYAHYQLNESPVWKRLGDFAAHWSIKQASLGRWYGFDIYRTAHRTKCALWNSSSNVEVPVEQQGVLEMYADLTASTGVFSANSAAVWSTGPNPPPLANGDKLIPTKQLDGSANGIIPAELTEGTPVYIVNIQSGGVLTGTYAPTNPVKFQVSATSGGAPLTFATNTTGCSFGYLPQSLSTYTTANAGAGDVTFPYMPAWGNYVPIHVAAIMMARQTGNAEATTAIRDGALAFTAPMDVNAGGYYSAFDMATTA